MTTCGAASCTARVSAPASNTSTSTGVAPSVATAATFSRERVVPTTSWPAARHNGPSRRPMTPLAPARNIFMRRPHLIRDDELAAGSGGELPRDFAARQFELQHD